MLVQSIECWSSCNFPDNAVLQIIGRQVMGSRKDCDGLWTPSSVAVAALSCVLCGVAVGWQAAATQKGRRMRRKHKWCSTGTLRRSKSDPCIRSEPPRYDDVPYSDGRWKLEAAAGSPSGTGKQSNQTKAMHCGDETVSGSVSNGLAEGTGLCSSGGRGIGAAGSKEVPVVTASGISSQDELGKLQMLLTDDADRRVLGWRKSWAIP